MLQRAMRSALEFYAGRVPYHRGKGRAIETLLRVCGEGEADQNLERIVERQGLRWKLAARCPVQRRLLRIGAFDVHDVREVRRRLGQGSVFFDVGAYFGYYAMLAAQRDAQVFAFEPVPINFAMLASHREMNGFDSLEALPVALSDVEGTVHFALPTDENRGRGHLAATGDAAATIEVRTMTLDAFARERSLTRLDGMKLDVEGAEMKVLAGGAETIARWKPWILLELNPPCLARFGTSDSALLEALRRFGYRFFRATSHGLEPFTGLEPTEDYTNIFCLSD